MDPPAHPPPHDWPPCSNGCRHNCRTMGNIEPWRFHHTAANRGFCVLDQSILNEGQMDRRLQQDQLLRRLAYSNFSPELEESMRMSLMSIFTCEGNLDTLIVNVKSAANTYTGRPRRFLCAVCIFRLKQYHPSLVYSSFSHNN